MTRDGSDGRQANDFGEVPALSFVSVIRHWSHWEENPNDLSMRMIVSVVVGMPALWDRLGGSQDEPAGLDTLGPDQAVGQFSHELRGASQEDDFKASSRVEMDVCRRDHAVEVEVLDLREPVADSSRVVVVDQGHDPHRLGRVVADHFLDQGRAHQPTDGLATVRILVLFPEFIELLQEFAANRDAETDEGIFHGNR